MIWVIFAAMALVALAVPLIPLFRGGIKTGKQDLSGDGRGPALAVYDDQLQEIETEIDRGKLAPELGDEMRTEIKRRMVALADLGPERGEDQGAVQGPAGFSVAVIIGIVTIIGLAVSLYLWLGRPDLSTFSRSGSPIATAIPELDATDTIEAGDPEDAAGWFAHGRRLWLAGNPGDAANAYGQAIRLAPDNAEFLASQGGALIDAMGGQVSPPARFVLTKAMAIDPDHPLPRFYLGLGLFQDGNFRGALTAWQELEERSQPGSPWLPNLRLQITRAEEMLGEVPTSKSTAPLITPESRAAVDAMSADEQAEFINAMVARLEARLEASPDDLDGWLRLARTYTVLGREADAARALETALALAPESERARIEADFADRSTDR